MRIISGNLRGRKLIQIQGRDVRPTSDRTREAVFNIIGPRTRDALVLDLFAGTGALGLEALSRGARHTTFIDKDCGIVRQNLTQCRMQDQATVLTMDLTADDFTVPLSGQQFDLVFIDPPYGKGYIEQVMSHPRFTDILSRKAWIITEYSFKENLQIHVPGLDIFKQKKYSKTKISIMRAINQRIELP